MAAGSSIPSLSSMADWGAQEVVVLRAVAGREVLLSFRC